MKKLKIYEVIRFYDDCTLVNPRQNGLEIQTDATCKDPDPLVRYDNAAQRVRENVENALAKGREQLEKELEQKQQRIDEAKKLLESENEEE